MPDIVAPETPVEEAIAAAWAEVLGIEPIGRHDRFTDLGGTSLGVEKTLLILQRTLGRSISAELLAEDPTVEQLGAAIDAQCATDFRSNVGTCTRMSTMHNAADFSLEEAQPPVAPARVFMFAGAGASAVSFLSLATALAGHCDSWAFHAHGFHSRGLADPTVGCHARRHLRDIRRLAPDGPLVLIGHSFGGHIAMECARRLRKEGRTINAVVLLDTILPHGNESVADIRLAAGAGAAPPDKPAFTQRLLTHWRILTAGLYRHDPVTHQAVMWEHAIRIQNRIKLTGTPPHTVVLVTDDNATMADRWSALRPSPRVVRVPGDHLSVLHNPESVGVILKEIGVTA